ncbi:MAG: hypothetical protein K1X88_00020 [Nannocystaceae bacterium]|nr:hypothetical protein [Nannocystaceae bacterium]
MTDPREAAANATHEALTQAWSRWGTLDADVLTHLINPAFMGGPRWPAMRQAYRVARRDGAVLLASDGLADPFDDGPTDVNGCGLEFYAITRDPLERVAGSWLWDVVWQMSNFAAGHGGIRSLLDELGVLSTELYDVGIPAEHAARFVNEHGRVGVLLGVADPHVPALVAGPRSSIRLVAVTLLTLDELALAASGGGAGRARLAGLLAAQPDPTHSSLQRRSVLA